MELVEGESLAARIARGPVSTESGFASGTPIAVATADANLGGGRSFVDASRDGRELLFARPVTESVPRAPVTVVINWAPDMSR